MRINIDGKYPAMANWVVLKKSKGKIIARNAAIDEEIELSNRQAKYLTMLNGDRNPRKIEGFTSTECITYMHLFENMMMLRQPGRTQEVGADTIHTIFIPDKLRKTNSVVQKILNFLLLMSFVPVFVVGCISLLNSYDDIGYEHIFLGLVGGTLIGTMFHELAHATACLSFSGRWLELGWMWSGLFPGAYVMIDDYHVKGRLKKLQIHLAGVEMNFLVAGICFMLAASISVNNGLLADYSGMFFYAGYQNIFLGLLNLCFYNGLDGEHAIATLLGRPMGMSEAKKIISNQIWHRKKAKEYWNEYGTTNGTAKLCVSSMLLVNQIIVPLIILSDIGMVIGWIFV